MAGLGEDVDQAKIMGALGRQGVAGERQFHGDLVGNALGQPQQTAAGGHQSSLDLGDAER